MRKIILFNMITVDGFFAGPNGEIDWHHTDEDFNDFAIEQLNSAGGLIFGRLTYQMMAGYWPTPAALTDDPVVANLMNSLPKIVFSKTLKQAEWSNTRLVTGDAAEEIAKLKNEPGRDLLVFGSGDLTSTLTKLGLIDEYRLMVNPVVLGRGSPMFQDLSERLKLTLLRTITFRSGNVVLCYRTDRNKEKA